MMMKKICAAALAGAALLVSAQARAEDLSPGYVGAGIGVHSNYSATCYDFNGCNDKTNSSGKLYGGYTLGTRTGFAGHQLTDSLELSTFWINGQFASANAGMSQYRKKTTGLSLSWATEMELGSGFALNSRIGLAFTRTRGEARDSLYGDSQSSGDDRIAPMAGLGLSYALNRNWSLRADYDYVPIKTTSGSRGNGHVNMWTAGAAYHF